MQLSKEQMAINRLMCGNTAHSCKADYIQLAIKALEKQIPYKPVVYEDKYYSCKCGNVLMMKWKFYNTQLIPKHEGLPYCLNCGQKIDWSDLIE